MNNNLFGIAFEFLFFISFLLFLISRSKIEKGFFLFICFLIFMNLLKQNRVSPLTKVFGSIRARSGTSDAFFWGEDWAIWG